jgi:hypothetical protein
MTADIVPLNPTRTAREQTDIGWRLLRGQDNPFLTKVAAAGQNASALGLTSTIAKIDWGKHRIWSSLFVSPDRVSASPEIGSRYGQREHQSSALFLTGEWYKTAEFFSTGIGADAKLMNITDALMDHLFQEDENALWAKAGGAQTISGVQEYLDRYPAERYVAEARAKLNTLKKAAEKRVKKPGNLYILSIGISKYPEPFTLGFAPATGRGR